MIIKKYIVNNMNEAITRIRYELGKDAVIVSQRKVKKPGFVGFFSKKMLEVTAAVDKKHKEETNANVKQSINSIKNIINQAEHDNMKKNISNVSEKEELEQKLKTLLERRNSNKQNEIELKKHNKDSELSSDEVLKEIKEMKNLITEVLSGNNPKEKIKNELENNLVKADIKSDIVKEMLEKVKNDKSEEKDEVKVKKVLKDMINISKNKKNKVCVLVGPTGVGKTTTIAKLAGKFALIEKKRVGLITIDTYRIGAVEQLKTYADIMNLPFKVVFTIDDMKMAIESMKECDIILIDTTGRSSKNIMQISELRAYINNVNTKNIHLVISCTTKKEDIVSISEGYNVLGYNNVIITKLDETTTYGSIINILRCVNKPLSFITTGQNVPDDIKVPTQSELTSLIIGEKSIC